MTNERAQANEILSLSSTYTAEEISFSVGDGGQRAGTFFAFLRLPKGFRVVYKTFDNEAYNRVVMRIKHLPPIALKFQLSKQYPSQTMPDFTLSCPWLSSAKLLKLCQKLESLWEDRKGSAVLLQWTNVLKVESLKLLGIARQLNITWPHLMELRRTGKVVLGPRRKQPRWMKKLREKPVTHPRIVVSPMATPLHRFLESYNDHRTKAHFLSNLFLCSVCFEKKASSQGSRFSPCGHVYCKPCMGEYFKARISEALITSMPCPYEKCTSEAHPQQVKEVIDPELFNKYDTLLLSVTLDQMGDITNCPRLECRTPVMSQQSGNAATCPACGYVFCIACRQTYHGIEPCQLKEEVKKIVSDYQSGSLTVKAQMEKRYGKTRIQAFINDSLSDEWIKNNSKNCPNCKASIEKLDGCNKMTCGKCQTYFCWLCLAILEKKDPYRHYNDPDSKCVNALFAIIRNLPLGAGIIHVDPYDDSDEYDEYDEEPYYSDGEDEDYDYSSEDDEEDVEGQGVNPGNALGVGGINEANIGFSDGSEQLDDEEFEDYSGSEQLDEEGIESGGSEQIDGEEFEYSGGSEQLDQEGIESGGSEQMDGEEFEYSGGSEQLDEEGIESGGSEQMDGEEIEYFGGSEQSNEEESEYSGRSEQMDGEEVDYSGESEQMSGEESYSGESEDIPEPDQINHVTGDNLGNDQQHYDDYDYSGNYEMDHADYDYSRNEQESDSYYSSEYDYFD